MVRACGISMISPAVDRRIICGLQQLQQRCCLPFLPFLKACVMARWYYQQKIDDKPSNLRAWCTRINWTNVDHRLSLAWKNHRCPTDRRETSFARANSFSGVKAARYNFGSFTSRYTAALPNGSQDQWRVHRSRLLFERSTCFFSSNRLSHLLATVPWSRRDVYYTAVHFSCTLVQCILCPTN